MASVFTSRFNPFTYDEMVKPLLYYKEAYDKAEEQYNNLAMDTESLLASLDPSSQAYSRMQNYAQELRNYTDDFSNGMTMKNRSALLSMRRRWASDVVPVQQANQKLEKMQAFRDSLLAKDSSVKFYNNYGVDDILSGKQIDNAYVSGKELTAKVASRFEALGKALYSNPEFSKVLGGQKFLAAIQNGMSPDELMSVLGNLPGANQQMVQALQDELRAAGIDNFSGSDRLQLEEAAKMGAYAGLAKPTQQFLNNENFIGAAEGARLAMAREQHGWQRELKEIQAGQRPFYTDPTTGTEYYSDGNYEWQKSKNADGTYTSTTPNRVKGKQSNGLVEKVDAGGNVIGYVDPAHPSTVYDSQGRIMSTAPSDNRMANAMPPLYFDAYYNDTSKGLDALNSQGGFNDKEAVLMYDRGQLMAHGKPNTLSPKAIEQINEKLKTYGLTFADVQIYLDHDKWSDSHYKIVYPGSGLTVTGDGQVTSTQESNTDEGL